MALRTRFRRKGLSFAERDTVRIGIVGSVIIAIAMAAALEVNHLPFISPSRAFSADFSDAGGLEPGDAVQVAGLAVGTVGSIGLADGHVRIQLSVTDDAVQLGDRTRARIIAVNILGKKAVELDPAGAGLLAVGTEIPLSQTTAPYDITQALGTLTTDAQQLDVNKVASALNSISGTLQNTPAELKSALSSISRIATTVAARNDTLQALLSDTNSVSGVLAARDQQIDVLLTDGTNLFAELNQRSAAIASLLTNATAVAQQLRGLVHDQQGKLGPALNQLTQVITLLNKNKTNIDDSIARIGPYIQSLGESVGSGPFFDAYVVNMTDVTTLPIYPSILTGLGK